MGVFMGIIIILPLTLIIPIVRKERPSVVFTVNMIAWAVATMVLWNMTMGFDSYGWFAIPFFVAPSLVVILITCAVYLLWYRKSKSK